MWIQDDRAIMDLAQRREARSGLWVLSIPPGLMPNSHPFEYQHKGDLTHAALMAFVQATRKEYARQTGEGAEAPSEGATRDTGGEAGDTDAGVGGGGSPPAEEATSHPEISVEHYLKTKKHELRDQVAESDRFLNEVIDRNKQLHEEYKKICLALNSMKGVADASTNSGSNSKERKQGKKTGVPRRRGPAAGKAKAASE